MQSKLVPVKLSGLNTLERERDLQEGNLETSLILLPVASWRVVLASPSPPSLLGRFGPRDNLEQTPVSWSHENFRRGIDQPKSSFAIHGQSEISHQSARFHPEYGSFTTIPSAIEIWTQCQPFPGSKIAARKYLTVFAPPSFWIGRSSDTDYSNSKRPCISKSRPFFEIAGGSADHSWL